MFKVLKYGMRDPRVSKLQELLGVKPANGYFGKLTLAAVKIIQDKYANLERDGIVGQDTWDAIVAEHAGYTAKKEVAIAKGEPPPGEQAEGGGMDAGLPGGQAEHASPGLSDVEQADIDEGSKPVPADNRPLIFLAVASVYLTGFLVWRRYRKAQST